MKKLRSRGLTLIELIVVVAILAVLAMIIIPKLDGLQNNANHAAAAASVSDTTRYLQTWRITKQAYPDGWDSLTDGSAIWSVYNPANKTASGTPPYGKGLHSAFATGGKFKEDSLTPDEVTALRTAGIITMYDVNSDLLATKRPGDVFTKNRELSGTPKAVFVNDTSNSGKTIIDRIYRQNQRVSGGGTPGVVPNGRRLLALGLGPMNDMVGKLTMEAPSYANVDSSLVYNRNIVLFEVGGTGKVMFKAVVAADGDLLDDLTTYINRDVQ